MKRIEACDFSSHVGDYLESDEVMEIARGGKAVGFYIPVAAQYRAEKRQVEKEQAFRKLGEAIELILEETGLTEDEFVAWFDLTKPFPPDIPVRRTRINDDSTHATGH